MFSVPDNSDNLLLLSWAIRVFKPNFTRVVFSSIPVSLEAFLSNSSSILIVILISKSTHDLNEYFN